MDVADFRGSELRGNSFLQPVNHIKSEKLICKKRLGATGSWQQAPPFPFLK